MIIVKSNKDSTVKSRATKKVRSKIKWIMMIILWMIMSW